MVMPTDQVMIQQALALVAGQNPGMAVEATVWLTVNGRPSTEVDTLGLSRAPGAAIDH
jgi:hypothetical protein